MVEDLFSSKGGKTRRLKDRQITKSFSVTEKTYIRFSNICSNRRKYVSEVLREFMEETIRKEDEKNEGK